MPPIFPKPFKPLIPEEKISQNAFVDFLCLRVWEEKIKCSGKLPHGFITKLVKQNITLFPSLTRDTINNALRKHLKAGIACPTSYAKHHPMNLINNVRSKESGSSPPNNAASPPNNTTSPPNNDAAQPNNDPDDAAPSGVLPSVPSSPTTPTIPSPISVTPSPQKGLNLKGGRPKGTTIANKKNKEIAIVASINEVADIYQKERKEAIRKKKKMRRGRLQEIIKQVKEQNNLPEDVVIKKKQSSKEFGEGELKYFCAVSPHHFSLLNCG